jgi:hypothetical protein
LVGLYRYVESCRLASLFLVVALGSIRISSLSCLFTALAKSGRLIAPWCFLQKDFIRYGFRNDQGLSILLSTFGFFFFISFLWIRFHCSPFFRRLQAFSSQVLILTQRIEVYSCNRPVISGF